MKIRQSVLDKLNTNKGLALIMTTLDCGHTKARSLVLDHEADDDLTKISMINAIKNEFKLDDQDILEDSEEVDTAETAQN